MTLAPSLSGENHHMQPGQVDPIPPSENEEPIRKTAIPVPPAIPSCYKFHLVGLWMVPLFLTVPGAAVAQGICDRTPAVWVEIARVTRTFRCEDVRPSHLTGIQKLDVSHRRVKSLKAGDFSGLDSLELLNLSDNELNDLPDGIFRELGQLRELVLAGNSLTALPQGIFEELDSLERLWLLDNSFTSWPAGTFQILGSLKDLYLQSNPLTSLPVGVFRGLNNLEELVLRQTPLSSLPEGIFGGLSNLKVLDLTQNSLAELPEGVFAGLNALDLLDLSENGLTHLPEGTFRGLDTLKVLALDSNRLSSLPERIFNGLSGLYNLLLSNNSLSQLPASVFRGLDKLGELRLENNVLTSLPAGVFDDVLDTLGVATYRLSRSTGEIGACVNCGGLFVDENLKATIAFAPTSQIAVEGQTVRVTVTLSRPLPVAVRIHYSASDYFHPFFGLNPYREYEIVYPTPDDGVLFLAGETSKDIEVSLLEDGDTRVETIQFYLPDSSSDMPLLRSDGTGEKAPELETYFLAYRSDLDNQHVVTIVSGSLPPGLAPKDSPRFTDWAVGKQLDFHSSFGDLVYFRDGVRFRHDTTDYGELTGSYSYRYEGPHSGTVAMTYDEGGYCELQFTFVSETTGVILSKGCRNSFGIFEFTLALRETPAFVPVILKSAGRNRSFFTSEITLTNRWSEQARLQYTYTAHAGGGSGTASDVLGPGRQRVVPDAIAYLKKLGMPIPDTGNRLGTLKVEVAGVADIGVVVRTTTPVPDGRAGLSYRGVAPDAGFSGYDTLYLSGLRRNSQDRSNVALQHMGMSEEPVTLRTTVFSADPGDSRHSVLEDVTLGPGGFHQLNDILATVGYENGYVTVQSVGPRESLDSRFYAYGVINDNINSDGSFVFPTNAYGYSSRSEESATVIVETGSFKSELTLTNLAGYEEGAIVNFRFVSDQIQAVDHTAVFSLTLERGEQRILSNFVDELRRQEVEGIGPRGRAHIGTLFIDPIQGGPQIMTSVRTGSPDGRGGQYGVSYTPIKLWSAFRDSAWIYGLQQNAENRSNLALVNTGAVDENDIVFEIDIYEGVSGNLVNTVRKVRVPARRWRQINAILAEHAPGTSQGYLQIRTMSGKNSFLAYAVINDGAAPGRRSGDGAYLAAQD